MKRMSLSLILLISLVSAKAQQDTTLNEYLIKYEVQMEKGKKLFVTYTAPENTGGGSSLTISDNWTYTYKTKNIDQNVQVNTMAAQSARSLRGAKVWNKINIYVNGKLIKSEEEKSLIGHSVQVSLYDIK